MWSEHVPTKFRREFTKISHDWPKHSVKAGEENAGWSISVMTGRSHSRSNRNNSSECNRTIPRRATGVGGFIVIFSRWVHARNFASTPSASANYRKTVGPPCRRRGRRHACHHRRSTIQNRHQPAALHRRCLGIAHYGIASVSRLSRRNLFRRKL